MNKRRVLPLAIFFMSFCLLMLEIFLTRIFSVALYYHFAFMSISVALLGLGASGMAIYFFPNFFSREKSYKLMVSSSILFSLFVLVALFALMVLKIELYVTLTSVFNISILYFLIILPFFFGGMVVSLILTHFSKRISKLYFYDLLGASLGSLGVILLLKRAGGPNGLIFISLLGLVIAIILSFYFRLKKTTIVAGVLGVIVFSLFVIGMVYDPFTLEFTRGAGDSPKEFSAWNAISRVDLFDIGEKKLILIDSDASTDVLKVDNDIQEVAESVDTIHALAYQITSDSEVLIIGVGGGRDVIAALLFNNTVVGVEINDIIIDDLMKDRLRAFSGNLYFRDDVNIVVDEGRSYIRRSQEKYDLIQMSLVDTLAATAAGAFTLAENNLYTTEAFVDYLSHLKEDGVLSSTRYTFAKPQATLRLTGIALEALENLGVKNPQQNILLVKEDLYYTEDIERPRTPIEGTANLMIKRSAFTEKEVEALLNKADKEGFEVVYNPFEVKDNLYDELIRSENREEFFEAYPLDLSPPTDNKPFFFYTLRFGDTLDFFKLASGEYESELFLKTNIGLFLLLMAFFLTLGLAALFILVPLIIIKRKDLKTNTLNKLIILVYFAGLGMGFIMIEIVLMQKFILFLGHPIYALGVILASLLIFSGIGSYSTNRISEEKIRKTALVSLIILVVLVIIYLFTLPYIFNSLIGRVLFFRIIISILLLLPLGFVMGRFFPLGIKIIDEKYHTMIPWAWGINGTLSVVGSVLAIILAINLGFNLTLIIGLAFYLLSLGLIFKKI